MKPLLFLVPFLALAACTPSSRIAFVNTDQAIAQTSDWKAAQVDLKAFTDGGKPAYDTAVAALKKAQDAKAPEADLKNLGARVDQIATANNDEVKRRSDATAQRILQGMGRILPRLAEARGVGSIVLIKSAAYIDPRLDVTGDLADRYNAGDGAGAAEIAALKAKAAQDAARIAQLEAEKAKQGSPPVAVNAQPRKAAP